MAARRGLSGGWGRCLSLAGLLLVLSALGCGAAWAGQLKKADIERRFGYPQHVEDKLSDVPVWPVSSPLAQERGPVAYVFESIDIASLPGFEGNPMNFLISIDRQGNFIDVELLSQREPVFTFRDLGGQKDRPLRDFIAQYAGHSINDQYLIALDAARNRTGPTMNRPGQTTLDGVAKATTSIRIINQTVLTAALEVARARLGFADRKETGPPARVRPEVDERASFDALLQRGVIGHVRLSNAEVERLFAGTEGAGLDEYAASHPDETGLDLYVAYLNAPTIGRAVLGDAAYQAMMASNHDHLHLWWVASGGRHSILDGDFVPGTQSARLALAQDGLSLEFRDQGMDPVRVAGLAGLNASQIFGVNGDASFDPARAADVSVNITRTKGQVFPTLIHRSARLKYAPPEAYFAYPPRPLPPWVLAWQARWLDIVVVLVALGLLCVVLAKPRRVAQWPARLRLFRLGFLAFTLVYLGWYAQGQLSVVQITGALKSIKAGQGVAHYLYDPVSLVLIAFTAASFPIWGRGTFCGWLCPFGALQEFVGLLGRAVKFPALRIAPARARRLAWVRHGVLAALVLAALFAPEQGEMLNEVEPFKTVITLGFDRSGPFVAYAVALLALGAAYYKFFCRFLCPLGSAMSLGGRLRRWNWLPRRSDCGRPCQRCKAACRYDAIEASGAIRYGDCFQCLDCVGIYHDPQRCVPIVLQGRAGTGRALTQRPTSPGAPR